MSELYEDGLSETEKIALRSIRGAYLGDDNLSLLDAIRAGSETVPQSTLIVEKAMVDPWSVGRSSAHALLVSCIRELKELDSNYFGCLSVLAEAKRYDFVNKSLENFTGTEKTLDSAPELVEKLNYVTDVAARMQCLTN